MSVIIRLQNLPWSANALDIRQFFKGLSIPEGGVHIVGGELGDAFIAFSTDEDARQAMMHDRECIKEVQVRLLLSSRAEMQKVIETARLQSISLLQQMAVRTSTPIVSPTLTPNAGIKMTVTQQQQQITQKQQQQQKVGKSQTITMGGMNNLLGQTTSFLDYQQQAGITPSGAPIFNSQQELKAKADTGISFDSSRKSSVEERGSRERDRRRSSSRERDRHRSQRDDSSRSHSRDRDYERDRGRDRERDRDSKGRRYERSRRSRSHDSRERSVDRSRSRGGNRSSRRTESKERELSMSKSNSSPWSAGINLTEKDKGKAIGSQSTWDMAPMNAYQTNQYQTTASNSYSTTSSKDSSISLGNPGGNSSIQSLPEAVIPAFHGYTSTVTNNYSINVFGGAAGSNSNSNDSLKPSVLQNPYTTALQNANNDSDSQATNSSLQGITASSETPSTNNFQTLPQEHIAFAKTNPYEQMYPTLFAQAAAQSMPRSNATAAQRTNSPICRNNENITYPESSSIRVSNMCSSTNYSDLRKFFAGLFIPHNGIKMVNDRHGLRVGVAFIQFSRQSSVLKALTRNHSILKSKSIKIEVVTDDEFAKAEDSYRPSSRFDRQSHNNDSDNQDRRNDGDSSNQTGNDHKNPFKKQNDEATNGPFNVLYIEDLPPLTTEQDIMKMFSSYTIYDILLMPSAENRRGFVAHVKFSLAEDAKAAHEDKSKHLIGYRKVRVNPGKEETMEMAKEKLRLANEQLMKEEQEEEAAKIAASFDNSRNSESPEVSEIPTVDITEDDTCDTTGPMNTSARISTRDPRLIPSLFDMPATKPPMDTENNKMNITAPADPRLRTRQRPSRFDNDTKNMPNNNNMSNMINNNSNNNNMNNNNMNGNNGNGINHPMAYQMNPFNNNNNGNNNNGNNNNNNINGNGNGNMNFNEMYQFQQMNPMENNFVLLYNCSYNIRNNEVAELFISANLQVKHVEMLNTDRGIPAGEFIVEVSNPREANVAIKDFHNIHFHGRSLRIRQISPQEIANRLRKPFMNYIPGGNGNVGGFGFNNMGGGMFMNNGGMRNNNRDGGGGGDMNYNGNNNNNMHGGNSNVGGGGGAGVGGNSPIRRKRGMQGGRSGNRGGSRNDFDDNDDTDLNDDERRRSGGGGSGSGDISSNNINHNNHNSNNNNNNNNTNNGIPEKFNRPDCVLAMENVPYKADSEDILRFFGNFNLRPDDIIRRFNDEGAPTGDARVSFASASDAREAYEQLNRKQIFNRTIYLNVL